MYLTKRTYVKNWAHMMDAEKHSVTVTRGGAAVPVEQIDPAKISYIIQDVGYWRKANAIHQWFVDNVQHGVDDCKEYDVSVEQLKELLGIVEQVLADHSLAGELLPTQSGFFFGSTEYDEWYFKDLEETRDILTEALKNESGDYQYQSSW
jgi:hypothetical protein